MKTRMLILSVLLLICPLLVSPVIGQEESLVKVGAITPMSGSFARFGQQVRGGLEEVQSSVVKLIYEDEGCNPAKALSAYKRFSELDRIKYFIGPFCGSPQPVIASQVKGKDQLVVLGSSAPRRVFSLAGGNMLSSQYAIEDEAKFLADSVYNMGHKNLAALFLENEFSRAHENAFRENFKGNIKETFAYTAEDAGQLRTILLRIKKLNVDALYVPDAYPLLGGLMREMRATDMGKIPVFSVFSARADDVIKAMSGLGENLIFSYPDIGEADVFKFYARLALEMLNYGVEQCKLDVECVKHQIKSKYKLDEYGVVPGNFILLTIRSNKFIPYTGLTQAKIQ